MGRNDTGIEVTLGAGVVRGGMDEGGVHVREQRQSDPERGSSRPRRANGGRDLGSDVPLVFGNFEGGSAARALGRVMRTAWARFVHTGDPGWPPFDRAGALTRIFDTSPRVSTYPEQASAELWRHDAFDALDLQ
jgi:hypothetical protein